jgi:mannosylglycerate hydrolase
MLRHMVEGVERYFVVPHTHWDREWYRPLEVFRLMLGATVDGILETLERDPGFASFTLDGQAILLEDYLEVRPENETRLRALIAAERIEIGPSYVLPDEFLVGAEALVRNLLIGRAVCERFGGRPSPAGYLPDSFGHPLQLPQILAGFGLQSMLFSRGLGDELDDLGVVFNWAAPDGSAVLAIQLLPDYGNFAGIDGLDDAEARVRGLLSRFGPALARGGVRDVVLCNGSDHLPVAPEIPAVCAELQRRFPGSTFAIARYEDYVSGLRTGEIPTWTGELLGSRLLNVLRGVNSARLYLKQANERAEQRLLTVETLSALCVLGCASRFPHDDFDFAWRELLKCHPHDSICGCSCDEVHRDMLVRYASLDRTLDALATNALRGLASTQRPDAIGVVNALPYARSAVVQAPGTRPTLVELGGFEARTVELAPADSGEPRTGDRIENDRFRVQGAPDGTVTITDLRAGRAFAGLHALEDEADVGDLYNFCPLPGGGVRHCSGAAMRVLSEGPVRWELEITYAGDLPRGVDAERRSRADTVPFAVRTVVRLHRGSDRIEFVTTVENAAEDHRLRVVFPVGDAPGFARAEGHFAVAHRAFGALEPRTLWCEPPDPTQHAIGAVAIGALAVITRGLPEYEARATGRGAELCLTLLRCVGLISRATGEIETRPVSAGPRMATPEGQCLGQHVLEYALVFDAEQRSDVALLRASQDYRSPLLIVPAGADFAAPLALDGDIVFSCLKGAEDGDGLILRVFNPGSAPASLRVGGALSIERLRLDETGAEPLPERVTEVGAGEIATLRLRASP